MEAIRNYKPRRYGGGLTLLRVSETGELAAPPSDYGWSAVCGRVDIAILPRAHHAMFAGKSVRLLAENLQARLDAAEATTRDGGLSGSG